MLLGMSAVLLALAGCSYSLGDGNSGRTNRWSFNNEPKDQWRWECDIGSPMPSGVGVVEGDTASTFASPPERGSRSKKPANNVTQVCISNGILRGRRPAK